MTAASGSGHGASSGQLIGRRMTRVEDVPLLRGQGRFVDDLPMPDALHVGIPAQPGGAWAAEKHRRERGPDRCPACTRC